ncbi:hypothetical protein [Actinopolymorpha sp. B9G3]|uniref:hypothetical protein n=1 Tax=Actinopolymorpha sp. B9G3 TaxID=3158970 RepID=UPI0032D95EAE
MNLIGESGAPIDQGLHSLRLTERAGVDQDGLVVEHRRRRPKVSTCAVNESVLICPQLSIRDVQGLVARDAALDEWVSYLGGDVSNLGRNSVDGTAPGRQCMFEPP